MPKSLIAFCGLRCDQCGAYLATIKNDDNLREKTAKEWNKRYNADGREPITEKDINCLGCLSETGPIYRHCKECGVRKCGLARKVKNCGLCSDYKTCQTIKSLHKVITDGKIVCDKIHQANF